MTKIDAAVDRIIEDVNRQWELYEFKSYHIAENAFSSGMPYDDPDMESLHSSLSVLSEMPVKLYYEAECEFHIVSARATIVGESSLIGIAKLTAEPPPPVAEFLIGVFLPSNRRDAVIGDLEERFTNDLEIMSLARARRRYWASALSSLGPLVLGALRRGLSALLLEAVQKYFQG